VEMALVIFQHSMVSLNPFVSCPKSRVVGAEPFSRHPSPPFPYYQANASIAHAHPADHNHRTGRIF
jgi:hypothetical protein